MTHPRARVGRFTPRIGVLFAVTVASTAAAAGASAATNVEEVIVVFKTHFDIGYTDLAANVVQNYRTTMIDKALGVCDATRDLPAEQQFVWTLPGWPLTQILWPGQEPVRRQRIEDAIRGGRFVWHALPVTTHTESLELEDLVRGMRFSAELARAYGLPLPRDAKMTDVPSHCWALPTILAQAGVEFLHLGCNRASTPPKAPPLFWWEGPDGSRVLTMLVLGYGTGLTPPEGWPHKTWLALTHTGDNHGPPTPDEVKKLLADAAAQLPGVKVRMGRLSDFADAIRRESPDLPVVRGDMPDTWIHGIMSHPADTAIARRVRPKIGYLETLNTVMKCWGIDVPDVKDTVAKAYEESLMYGEHTWGFDAKRFPRLYGEAWEESHGKGVYAKAEESWAEHGNYIRTAGDLVEPALDEHVRRLAENVAVEGLRIVVYNPLPFERDPLVTVRVPARAAGTLRRTGSSDPVRVERDGDMLCFVARAVPPTGYATYGFDKAGQADAAERVKLDRGESTLEGQRLRVKVDAARGGVVSLVDKRTGREMVAAGEVLGRYLYQRFDADDAKRYVSQYAPINYPWVEGDFGKPGLPPASEAPRRDASPADFDLRMESGPVSARAVMTSKADGNVPHGVTIAVTVYREHPYADVEWRIENKAPTPWPEAGWLCFPFDVASPQYRLARLGAIVDPAHDLQPATNVDVFCLNGGMAIDGADASIGVCPIDSPLVSIGRPGLWRLTRGFAPEKPTVYVNLFNNQWSTNFSQWVGGTFTSRVRIWAAGRDQSGMELATLSTATRCPVPAAVADGPAGKLPPEASGLGASRAGVAVTAFGANPFGAGTLLRVWEQAGQGGPFVVQLPAGSTFTSAQRCNLRGEPVGQPAPVEDHQLGFDLRPYSPASFILR